MSRLILLSPLVFALCFWGASCEATKEIPVCEIDSLKAVTDSLTVEAQAQAWKNLAINFRSTKQIKPMTPLEEQIRKMEEDIHEITKVIDENTSLKKEKQKVLGRLKKFKEKSEQQLKSILGDTLE